jgi:hypothetical protein
VACNVSEGRHEFPAIFVYELLSSLTRTVYMIALLCQCYGFVLVFAVAYREMNETKSFVYLRDRLRKRFFYCLHASFLVFFHY